MYVDLVKVLYDGKNLPWYFCALYDDLSHFCNTYTLIFKIVDLAKEARVIACSCYLM